MNGSAIRNVCCRFEPVCSIGAVALAWTILTGTQSFGAATTGNPRYDAVVQKAVGWLKSNAFDEGRFASSKGTGYRVIAAYALFKAGAPITSHEVSSTIQLVRRKVDDEGVYHVLNHHEEVYEAGMDAMFLADTDALEHRPEIQAIANFLIEVQGADGSWDYPDGGLNGQRVGDTSMNQYALLGLWAATRAEIPIPPRVWDMAAQWHVGNQEQDGGFAYHPGVRSGAGTGDGMSTLNMSAGGSASLGVIRMHLYPEVPLYGQKGKKKKKDQEPKKFGKLEKVEVKDNNPNSLENYKPQSGLGQIDSSIGRSLDWVRSRFNPNPGHVLKYYFYYTLERTGALNSFQQASGLDWYNLCGNALIDLQGTDGSYNDGTGEVAATSFVILFYMRSTGKILGIDYGGGLQLAGRDLPDDLTTFDPNAKEKPKKLGPLDELLAALENADFDQLEEAATDLVEKVQIGDREELVGHVDRLLKLAKHPNADVKRTALWALGRSGDLMLAPILIDALRTNNVDVMIEARNALCYISRRPNGFGLESSPFDELADDASDDERTAAANAWREKALGHWEDWWYRIRPYSDRDDLAEVRFRKRRSAAAEKKNDDGR